ncbi:beta-glucuronosyltransferase GlcAT14B-like protein, partial [Tanacetum coccineum]
AHVKVLQITAGQSGCDTQPDDPTLTCAMGRTYLESPVEERLELNEFVTNENVFNEVGNVRVISKSNLVTYRGPTMVTNTLHAAAILLREGGDWDWFINLSASDYPLVTQDGEIGAENGFDFC